MNNRRAILWLRNDLRLHDHEALTLLANTMDVLAPVYCLDPRQFEIQSLGFPQIGPLRARFLIDCLEDFTSWTGSAGQQLACGAGRA